MHCKVLVLVLIALAASPVSASGDQTKTFLSQTDPEQAFTISIDTTTARAVVDALKNPNLSEEQALRIAAMPGNAALIFQAAQFEPGITQASYARSILALARGQTLAAAQDPFGLQPVYDKLQTFDSMIVSVESSDHRFLSEISSRVASFSPPSAKAEVKAVFVLGGSSDGWVPDGDNQPFYIALNYFQDDLEGLRLLICHEIYHLVQNQITLRSTGTAGSGERLLRNLTMEGSATLVGDAMRWPQPGGNYFKWYKGKFERNLSRQSELTRQFESVFLYSLEADSADYDTLYGLLFTGGWDSNAYFLGYKMADFIDKKAGRHALTKAVFSGDPAAFAKLYIALADNNSDEPDIPRFSSRFKNVVLKLP